MIKSVAKSYILNIKIRSLVTKYELRIKLEGGTANSFNPLILIRQSWPYFDIQNLRLAILYLSEFRHRNLEISQLYCPNLDNVFLC
jgi:hypothetical protein